jgi:signal transduction histidine kinase
MAEMLLVKHGHAIDEDVVHRLQRIQKNADVERDLINELLELSRIKTAPRHAEMVDVDAMVRELGGMFESDLKGRAITLHVDHPLPVIHGEPARLRQVFQNLIDNAIKYMGDGPIREIHISAAVNAREAEFYVRDTGLGIEPEDIEKVFHVFRRGKNAHARQVAGKGVGLSNVKSIVETYHGKIWVESEVGAGSTFRFTVHGQHVPASANVASGTNVINGAGKKSAKGLVS